jgi:NAD(P)-dependent dehydrogenase (short-subunit alcohol dehydrogenase family)
MRTALTTGANRGIGFAIAKGLNRVDILVNNAGVLESGNLLEIDPDRLNFSLQVNFLAPLALIRQLVPGMNARGYGRIVNVSSRWGSFAEGLSGPAAYSISKAALNASTLSLAKDLRKDVKVNSMCPGWVRTRMGGEGAPLTAEQVRIPPFGWLPFPTTGLREVFIGIAS